MQPRRFFSPELRDSLFHVTNSGLGGRCAAGAESRDVALEAAAEDEPESLEGVDALDALAGLPEACVLSDLAAVGVASSERGRLVDDV